MHIRKLDRRILYTHFPPHFLSFHGSKLFHFGDRIPLRISDFPWIRTSQLHVATSALLANLAYESKFPTEPLPTCRSAVFCRRSIHICGGSRPGLRTCCKKTRGSTIVFYSSVRASMVLPAPFFVQLHVLPLVPEQGATRNLSTGATAYDVWYHQTHPLFRL